MHELSNEQIALVTADVENAGINFSHLSTDLIDHICCDIESLLNQGIAFDMAYSQVKKEFGIKGLRQVQQNTLMLIDKKYKTMKKSMKMIGMLAMALMAFGALFKIGHWPGAVIILFVGFFFTSMVFFPTFLYVVYKELNNKTNAPLFIIGFLGGVSFMIGVFFKIMHFPGASLLLFSGLGLIVFLLLPLIIILKTKTSTIHKTTFIIGILSLMIFLTGLILKMQHWPGANILLTFGSTCLVLVFVPAFYKLDVAQSRKIRADFIFGIAALTYFIIFGFLLSLNLSQNLLVDFKYQNKSFANTSTYLSDKNNEALKSCNNEHAKQIANQADLIIDYIDGIKVMIIHNQYGCTKEEAILLQKSDNLLHGKESNVDFILPENNQHSPLPGLKAEIEVFNQFYYDILKSSGNKAFEANVLFDTANKAIENKNTEPISWEKYHFHNTVQSAALNMLSLWQYKIRLAEHTAIISLSTKPKSN